MLSRLPTASLLAIAMAAVFGRVATALSQVVAGIYLSPTDFGIYATTTGIMIFTTVFRAGGAAHQFQTMTTAEFREHGGRILRYSLLIIVVGIALSMTACELTADWFTASKGYSRKDFVLTMVLLSVNYLLFNTACYPRFRMIAESRLREVSAMETALGLTRLVATYALAARGAGPLALAGATTAAQLVENVWGWSRAGLSWREVLRNPSGISLRTTAVEMRLPLLLAILASLNMQTETLIGSVFLPVTVIGFYFFASQLVNQPAMMMASSIRSVFTSAGAQVRGDSAKEDETIRVVFNGAMVFIPLVMMVIPAVFEPVERAVWHGKWADSRWPLLILSATMPYSTVLQLIAAPVTGIRNWRLAIRIDLLRCIPKILAAVAAGGVAIWLELPARVSGVVLASAVGGVMAVFAMQELHRILRKAGATTSGVIYELYSTPLAAILSAVAASGLAHSLMEPLVASMGERPLAFIEAGLALVIYSGLAILLLRFGYTPTLERLLSAVPKPFSTVARQALRLPAR